MGLSKENVGPMKQTKWVEKVDLQTLLSPDSLTNCSSKFSKQNSAPLSFFPVRLTNSHLQYGPIGKCMHIERM